VLPKIIFLLIVLVPSMAHAQRDSLYAKVFHSSNPKDKLTVFMFNEAIALPSTGETTYSVTITVTNIRNKNGVIRFKFYDETTPFPHDKGFLRIVVPKSEIVDGTYTATYQGFASKVMGIALQDDENSNWKLDMGWFLPKEGHAFSNYYHAALRRPVFSDFKFLLVGDTHVIMKMKYY
jgi:uncharacterized protein (DUF2141 family)